MTDSAHTKLAAYRERNGLKQVDAAKQFGVSSVTYGNWERGRLIPSRPYRDAIEKWTGGEVSAVSWPLSDRERRILERARDVQPMHAPDRKSGPLPREGDDDDVDGTGTED